ncbi:protein cortex [Diachasma alloeum]|uniref:Protein cortex n=1 Tax=Diachasma alloeum TaxID=454923 RepID=A0A4E0RLF0_9HYME|nr:protein cortex [Diachasma alloeum]THK32959.1 protein cortex [Diachasma alloeum]
MLSCNDCAEMLRRVLERQNERRRALQDEVIEGSSTPRRGSFIDLPRMRLMDKQAKAEPVPLYSLSSLPQKTYPIHSNNFYPKGNCQGQADRFIPNRRSQNFDFSKYCLMKKETQIEKDASSNNYVDVINQINFLESTWRKRLMIRAMQGLDVLSGIGNHRVLNISGNSRLKEMVTGRKDNRRRNSVVDEYEENIWKVKPRSRPLLGEHHHKIRIPNRSRPARGAIDWGSKNCIVAPVDINLHFFTMDESNPSHISISVESSFPGSRQVKCLKWNNAGDQVAMYSRSYTICVFDVPSSKILWSEECLCDDCDITCMNWSVDDEEIVVGCTSGKVSLFRTRESKGDRLIEHLPSHEGAVLNLAVSPNNRYLATSGIDKLVRIYLYPAMILYLEIGYYDATQAFAWHPWDSGTLCIGGGNGDGSLSLWDMQRQESIGYKRVAFLGHVKNMNWNKISGELVVQWYYWEGDKRFVTIPVLASWDRVVDVAQWSTRYGTHAFNVIWNPDHTKLGVQLSNALLIWDFFGYQESAWLSDTREKKKTAFFQHVKSALVKTNTRLLHRGGRIKR